MASAHKLFSLEGRVVLVGGASRGIGLALAEGLSSVGAVVTGFSRSAAPTGINFDYRMCDSMNDAAVAALVDDIAATEGRIDGYVHVAGITNPAQTDVQSGNAFRATVDTNLNSAYACCSAVARHMCVRQSGSIVVVTSIGSLQGFPGNPGYVAAKGGLRMLTKALALDLGSANIRVNAIAPGYIHTQMTHASFSDPVKHKERADRTILGRWGDADELIGATIFLISDASSYVTGTDVIVDGGWTAKGL